MTLPNPIRDFPVGQEIAIREAQPSDASSISGLLAQLGYPAPASEIPLRLVRLAAFPSALVLVAADKESAVGLITAHIIPTVHASEPVALLTALVVAESHRGQGIGSELVSRAERWAAGNGAVRVSVSSGLQRADTHRFYEQRNYQRTGLRFTKTFA
jgi:GNAT superfamily N-acetyltransferase